MLRKLFVVLAMAVAATATKNTTQKAHTGTKGDLTQKRGIVMYNAGYENVDGKRLEGIFEGTYLPSSAFGQSVGLSTLNSFFVKDKRTGSNKAWKNFFTISSSAFPAGTLTDFAGQGNSILMETYQVTSIDSDSGALLGSLNWAGSYAAPTTGTITGSGISMVFPVEGATGVYKGAKAVAIDYKAAGVRDVRIIKSSI